MPLNKETTQEEIDIKDKEMEAAKTQLKNSYLHDTHKKIRNADIDIVNA